MFIPGDLIFTHGGGFIGRSIRWAERAPGEMQSYASHVGGITSPGMVTEALWTVKTHPYAEALAGTPHQVWRCMALDEAQRLKVAAQAMVYAGRKYGAWKIGLHLADALLSRLTGSEVYAVRRLMFADRYPICSWVWAEAFDKALGLRFGVAPNVAQPDDMHDYVSRSLAWEMVFESKGGAA